MATRRNLCQNPAQSVSNAGWGGGSTPTRATGLTGFPRTTGALYSAGTFALSQAASVTPAVVYTASIYVKTLSFNWGGGSIYLEFYNSGGGSISAPFTGISATANVVTRFSLANLTAPAGAVTAKVVLDGQNFGTSQTQITCALIEPVAALDTYFDGDSVGATWDGTTGLSSSTLPDAAASDVPRPRLRRHQHLLVR